MPQKCRALLRSGRLCDSRAADDGYCKKHGEQAPTNPNDRDALRRALAAAASKLDEVLRIVTTTAEGRGWSWTIESLDERDWLFATVHFSRSLPGRNLSEEIAAIGELSLDNGLKLTVEKTSFHGHGVTELADALKSGLARLPWLAPASPRPMPASETFHERLERLLRRFHLFSRQLLHRHDSRPTLVIGDEYDVQDLLHALLKLHFEDVRPEEPAPSHAGASSRLDFLLKKEKTVVEVKMTSDRLRDKQVAEQLIIDIERYQSHPDCGHLVCFVYDPGGHIRNAAGLEADLSGTRGRLAVRTIVVSP